MPMLSLRSVHTTIDTLVYAHNIDPVRVFLTNFTVSRADLENQVVSWTDLFVRNRVNDCENSQGNHFKSSVYATGDFLVSHRIIDKLM